MAKTAKSSDGKTLVTNRAARHEYFVDETYETGLELKGTEVKSIRLGRANLKESYCAIKTERSSSRVCIFLPMSREISTMWILSATGSYCCTSGRFSG